MFIGPSVVILLSLGYYYYYTRQHICYSAYMLSAGRPSHYFFESKFHPEILGVPPERGR